MAKVNWNRVVSCAVAVAKSRGKEASVAQAKNVLNDLADYLVDKHESWEILEAVYRLARKKT